MAQCVVSPLYRVEHKNIRSGLQKCYQISQPGEETGKIKLHFTIQLINTFAQPCTFVHGSGCARLSGGPAHICLLNRLGRSSEIRFEAVIFENKNFCSCSQNLFLDSCGTFVGSIFGHL